MTTEYICPRLDYVLVRPIKRTALTIGSLYIPDNAHDPGERMQVLALGPDCVELSMHDVVLVPQYHAQPVKYKDEENLHIVREHDILAKVLP